MRWSRCDSGCTNNPSIHRRSFHVVVLLDHCNSRSPNLSDRDCASSISRYCGWTLQHSVLFGKFIMWSREGSTDQMLQGSIIATSVVYGAEQRWGLSGNILSWRLSLWLQMICPGIVTLFIWLCPESPRYLMAKDQPEKARAILATFHANGDADHPLVELEMTEMRQAIQETGMMSWRTYFDIRDLFKSRSRRYRMMLNITFAWFGQFSGNK
jgi:hypothetical protein